jgi:serine/threonine protein phosphatase 1
MAKSEEKGRDLAAPPGERIYAVGDIHGCDDKLSRLMHAIATDLEDAPGVTARFVFLGDYVDRGPASNAVIDRLIRLTEALPHVDCLIGNHEAMLLDFLEDPESTSVWVLHNGGAETLMSYGVDPGAHNSLAAMRDAFTETLPEAHLSFLRGLETYAVHGDYLFVHAGVRPDVPLERQSLQEMIWIRDKFLRWRGNIGKVVVHGHTPAANVEDLPWRIGLDTGAVYGGALSCCVLEGESRRYLQAS